MSGRNSVGLTSNFPELYPAVTVITGGAAYDSDNWSESDDYYSDLLWNELDSETRGSCTHHVRGGLDMDHELEKSLHQVKTAYELKGLGYTLKHLPDTQEIWNEGGFLLSSTMKLNFQVDKPQIMNSHIVVLLFYYEGLFLVTFKKDRVCLPTLVVSHRCESDTVALKHFLLENLGIKLDQHEFLVGQQERMRNLVVRPILVKATPGEESVQRISMHHMQPSPWVFMDMSALKYGNATWLTSELLNVLFKNSLLNLEDEVMTCKIICCIQRKNALVDLKIGGSWVGLYISELKSNPNFGLKDEFQGYLDAKVEEHLLSLMFRSFFGESDATSKFRAGPMDWTIEARNKVLLEHKALEFWFPAVEIKTDNHSELVATLRDLKLEDITQ